MQERLPQRGQRPPDESDHIVGVAQDFVGTSPGSDDELAPTRDTVGGRHGLDVEALDEREQRLMLGTQARQRRPATAKLGQQQRARRVEAPQPAELQSAVPASFAPLSQRTTRLGQRPDDELAIEHPIDRRPRPRREPGQPLLAYLDPFDLAR